MTYMLKAQELKIQRQFALSVPVAQRAPRRLS
jgi:hypothetical protein